jgi:hypothetical protein
MRFSSGHAAVLRVRATDVLAREQLTVIFWLMSMIRIFDRDFFGRVGFPNRIALARC